MSAPRLGPWIAAGRLVRHHHRWYWADWVRWVAFHCFPLAVSLVLKALFDRLGDGDERGALAIVAVLASVEVTRWALLWVAAIKWTGTFVAMASHVRGNLLGSLLEDAEPASARIPSSAGEAVSRFRDDTDDLIELTDTWLDLSGAAICAVLTVAVLGLVDLRATVVVAIPLVLVVIGARAMAQRFQAWRTEWRATSGDVTGFVGDLTGGVLAIKVAGANQAALGELQRRNRARGHAAVRDALARDILDAVAYATVEVGLGVVLLLLAPAVSEGRLSLGDLALFTSATVSLSALPRWGGRLVARGRWADVAVTRMARLAPGGDPGVVVAPRPVHVRGDLPQALPPERGPADRLERLEVSGLSATHTGGGGVRDVDLALRRGTLTVITGPVGSGKTTLLRAVLGLVRSRGVIRWNGAVIDEPGNLLVPPRAAYVPQVPRLFSEPLADTILLGADPAELDRAIQLACLDEDVAEMADGIETMVGPRGVRLSGGQVQRTGTARALARRPELLVVDDLSSALDVETEARLWDGLLSDGGATFLVVSHRLRVLERADQVVVLDHGRVVEHRGALVG